MYKKNVLIYTKYITESINMGAFSSWGSTFNTLGHINNALGTLNNYLDMKNTGATTGQALINSAANGAVGAARVEIASERYDRTGSMSGHLVNTLAGYGNTASNVNGAIGLLLSDPSTYHGMFGGCCHNFFVGGPAVFAPPPMFGTMVTPTFAGPVVSTFGPMPGPYFGGGMGFWC